MVSQISVTPDGIAALVRELHPLNAPLPMVRTVDGMLTERSEEQPRKVSDAIAVTPSGMTISVRAVQPWNALSPIAVMPDGSVTDVSFAH